MKPGDKLSVYVPAGKLDPITQTRKVRRRFDVEVVEMDDAGLRIKTEGCYPAHGFRVTWEHWRAVWEPLV